VARTLRDFLAFYLANSLVWDVARVAGNVGLMAAFGAPTLRALRRFRRRFAFTYHPEPAPEAGDP
jgi:energy-coupling factor transport system substrate-specific component